MKVWLLYSGQYSDRYVVGVFSESGGANIASSFVEQGDVQEFDVDSLIFALDRRMRGDKLFRGCINIETGAISYLHEPKNLTDETESVAGTSYEANVFARDVEHARKILVERRQAILRELSERGKESGA